MFSKSSKQSYSINFRHANRRNAYRVVPAEDSVELYIEHQPLQVENLSSGGIAFCSHYPLDRIERQPAELVLKTNRTYNLPVYLTLVVMSGDQFRCQLETSDKGHQKLCQFLVKQQIEAIRNLQKTQINQETL